jgi:hypothetical protein
MPGPDVMTRPRPRIVETRVANAPNITALKPDAHIARHQKGPTEIVRLDPVKVTSLTGKSGEIKNGRNTTPSCQSQDCHTPDCHSVRHCTPSGCVV